MLAVDFVDVEARLRHDRPHLDPLDVVVAEEMKQQLEEINNEVGEKVSKVKDDIAELLHQKLN